MGSNVIKENQLEILPKSKAVTVVEENKLPILRNRENMLPAIVKQRELSLIELKREFYKIKQQNSLVGVLICLKKVLILFAKIIRGTILASSRMIGLVMFSAIVIISTTIVTKNVVNSFYGVKDTEGDAVYSIYSVKDDEKAKAKAELSTEGKNEINKDIVDDVDSTQN